MTAHGWREVSYEARHIRLLRGQVVIREDKSVHRRYGSIIVPERQGRDPENWHVGTVLGHGPPAFLNDKPDSPTVPFDFVVGDRVFFSWDHNEREHTKEWEDGKAACWIPQKLVHAVLEP
jgi:co-chaperonin GroES (HSP10)